MVRSSNIRRRLIIVLIAAVMMGTAAIIVMPWMKTLYDPALRDRFTEYVDSLGFFGPLLMFGIQLMQVIIAIIPGEPVELMAGALYGGLGGLAMCLAGSVIASAGIFFVMRTFGKTLLERLFPRRKLEEFGFMKDSRRLEAVTLVLFLVPGTPKDMLTYVAGTTPIPMARFLIISTFARIPSVVSSTFIGDTVLSGRWHAAVIITVATFIVGMLGIYWRERIMEFCRRHSRRHKA